MTNDRLINAIYDGTSAWIKADTIVSTTDSIRTETASISSEINKITKEWEKNKMKEVLFLAPSWPYAKTVINNLSKTFNKKKIPYVATTNEFKTNSVHVTFVYSDPLKWTPDMFKDKTAVFGKKELRDKARELFPKLSMSIYKTSLEKYIIENTVDPTVCTTPPPTSYLPEIKNVHFNGPATVVLWKDGTKTVVMCQEGDIYSEETGLALCIAKKAFGNMPNFNNIFRKWVPESKDNAKDAFPSTPFEFFATKMGLCKGQAVRRPVVKAYEKLVEFRDTDPTEDAELDIDELIGYLGEALE